MLVGKFMQTWASMENAMNKVIASGLALDTIQEMAVCSNLQFRDKTKIIKTAIYHSRMTDEEKTEWNSRIEKIIKRSTGWRNVLAHNYFSPMDKGKAVEFFYPRAKGKVELSRIKWTEKDFLDRTIEIGQHGIALEDLAKTVKGAAKLSPLAVVLAGTDYERRNPEMLGLGPIGIPAAPHQETKCSETPISSEQTTPQSPPNSEE